MSPSEMNSVFDFLLENLNSDCLCRCLIQAEVKCPGVPTAPVALSSPHSSCLPLPSPQFYDIFYDLARTNLKMAQDLGVEGPSGDAVGGGEAADSGASSKECESPSGGHLTRTGVESPSIEVVRRIMQLYSDLLALFDRKRKEGFEVEGDLLDQIRNFVENVHCDFVDGMVASLVCILWLAFPSLPASPRPCCELNSWPPVLLLLSRRLRHPHPARRPVFIS